MNPILPTLPSGTLAAPTLDTSAANTYTDVNGLNSIKRDPDSPEALAAVAKQVEAMFLQMMLKSMRDASQVNDTDGQEMGMYQDMFDKQVALTISQHDDLGIGALLKRQARPSIVPAKALGRGEATASLGATSGAVAQTPAEFVNKVMPSIEQAAGDLGVNPMGILAQAALETGWGSRLPSTANGASSHNLFGIKAGPEWSGAKVVTDTVEFNNGVATHQRTAFRAYGSVADSVADFAKVLKTSPRYRDALAAGNDAQSYVAQIGKSGYATDPEYANKLNRILNSGALQAAVMPRTAKL